MGEKTGDWGIRSRRSAVGVRPEEELRDSGGRTKGDGGISGADAADALRPSQWQEEQLLPALDGCDSGVNLPDRSEKLDVVLRLVEGLDVRGERAGQRALRKSV